MAYSNLTVAYFRRLCLQHRLNQVHSRMELAPNNLSPAFCGLARPTYRRQAAYSSAMWSSHQAC